MIHSAVIMQSYHILISLLKMKLYKIHVSLNCIHLTDPPPDERRPELIKMLIHSSDDLKQ